VPALSKATLVERLRSGRDEVVSTVEAIDLATLEQGRYENGWNGRQIIAHIAAIEWTYARLIEAARDAGAATGQAERAEAPARGGIDAYNARQVAKREQNSVAQLVAEFGRNRNALIALVEATNESLFDAPVRSAGGRSGALGQVLEEVAIGHVRQHLADLRGTGGA
jgi:hypothetical protein